MGEAFGSAAAEGNAYFWSGAGLRLDAEGAQQQEYSKQVPNVHAGVDDTAKLRNEAL